VTGAPIVSPRLKTMGPVEIVTPTFVDDVKSLASGGGEDRWPSSRTLD
jgi:hypothetical protein